MIVTPLHLILRKTITRNQLKLNPIKAQKMEALKDRLITNQELNSKHRYISFNVDL